MKKDFASDKTAEKAWVNVISYFESLSFALGVGGEIKTLARNKGKGTKLEVFTGREASRNLAIFETLANKGPQNIGSLQRQLNKQKGLGGTYYASLNKRIHSLQNSGYLKQSTKPETGSKATIYELRMKAYLAMFLDAYSMQEILNQATDTQAAQILLALLNAISPNKD